MASYNKITIIGNLGRDPEVREYQGRKVANFSVAVNEGYTKSDGSKVERTEWFRVSLWDSKAEVAEKYLKQGDQVFIEGRLSTREFQDKDGKTRTSLEISGSQLTMLGSPSSGGTSPESGRMPEGNMVNEPTDSMQASSPEEDLPF